MRIWNLQGASFVLPLIWTACGSDTGLSQPTDGAADAGMTDVRDERPEADADGATTVSAEDFMLDTLLENKSCALACSADCKESTAPWTCLALGPWDSLPHAPACGNFDGTLPAAQEGRCNATLPTAEATAKTSENILPDGRRLVPEGKVHVLREAGFEGGFPANAMLVGRFLVVVDNGIINHSIRVVDTAKLASGADSPVVSSIKYPAPKALNHGMALGKDGVLYVAGGIPDPRVYAYNVDPASGLINESAAKSISLPSSAFAQAIAVSPDGKTMLVGDALSPTIHIVSLASADYGKLRGAIALPQADVFQVRFDPDDPTGNTAYATLWRAPTAGTKMVLSELDVSKGTATTIPVGKAPEDIAFLDARYMVVASALADTLDIVDRPARKVVASTPLSESHGIEPTMLWYDKANKRLYATLASANAIGVFDVDTAKTPPSILPSGNIPTGWWPTSVTVSPVDGTLFVTNGKGNGTGAFTSPLGIYEGVVTRLMKGSVQAIPPLSSGALAAATASHRKATRVQDLPGYPVVECAGAPYDFPIPRAPEDGPSARIKHVFFIVRENKTFDALFGDMPGVDGDPKLVMAPGRQDEIWPNARKLASEFAHMDNFYEDAEQSVQGHFWTVFGRTTDYAERRWLNVWGRGEYGFSSVPGVGDDTQPVEGNIFSILQARGLSVENGGEFVGGLPYRDIKWPGGSSESTVPDTHPACYLAGRARVLCNPARFTYAWLGNDHAYGYAAGRPNPGIMVAVNDEATGMFIDGLSRSPIWKESLVIVVEDDPQDGADHVDAHRTIALFASPWVKRQYVSKGHYDMASLHKLFMHIFGVPYPNEILANAPLPLDVFTSTPNYAPFTYVPRKFTDLSCNPAGTKEAKAAARWDFTDPDDQPGLSSQNMKYFRSLSDTRK